MDDVPSNQKQKPGSPFFKPSVLIPVIVLIIVVLIATFLITRGSNSRVVHQRPGYISVASSPSGADVYINGKKIGATHIGNYRLKPGSYSIVVRKDGYKDYTKDVDVKSRGNVNISANLSALTGTLSVSSIPQGAEVYINGKYKGIAPLTLTLKIGGYHIKVTKAGYKEYAKTITVVKDKTTNVSVIINCSWKDVNKGLYGGSASSLAINPEDTNIIYAGTKYGIFKSTNGGRSWRKVSDRGGYIVINPQNPDVIYTGAEGIFKSTDGGKSWGKTNNRLAGADIHSIAIDPENMSTLYVGADNCSTLGSGIFKSTDGGATWSKASYGWAISDVDSIVMDSGDPDIIYAEADGVFKTADRGKTWKRVSSSGSNFLVMDPKNTKVLYSGTYNSVFKSTNGGKSWSEVSIGLPEADIISFAINPEDPNIIYAGTEGCGVFKCVCPSSP